MMDMIKDSAKASISQQYLPIFPGKIWSYNRTELSLVAANGTGGNYPIYAELDGVRYYVKSHTDLGLKIIDLIPGKKYKGVMNADTEPRVFF